MFDNTNLTENESYGHYKTQLYEIIPVYPVLGKRLEVCQLTAVDIFAHVTSSVIQTWSNRIYTVVTRESVPPPSSNLLRHIHI